jgi:aminoglycoside phosphotransferase (APT) family kinase protein
MTSRTRHGAEQRVRNELARAFPDLPVREVDFLGSGMDSAAYLINEEWVFRFPKRAAAARALGREVALLPGLAGRVPVAVPRFAYLGRLTGSGRPVAGYPIIRGQPLTAQRFGSLARADQERVLATLAAFLNGVHGFPLAEAAAAGIVGIIDWGDLAIGDPDFDLLYLRQDYGEAFVRRLLGHYPHPEPARLLHKLRVLDACDHLQTIVAAGRGAAGRAATAEAAAALGEILASSA